MPAIKTSQASPENHCLHEAEILQQLFDREFFATYNTRLQRSRDDDPVYLPADENCSYHRILFAHGFFSSALHEVAHWTIAGPERRQQLDFGYWYRPDGRSAAEQQEFEQVEVKPQAIEWMLSRACEFSFQVSIDNLAGHASDPATFKQAIHSQVLWYCQYGLPVRAEQFRYALACMYGTNDSNSGGSYQLEAL